MIAGLGEKTDYVASVPNVDASKLGLSAEEQALFSKVGRATQISVLLAGSGLPEARAIGVLLALRAKGAVVPARVSGGGLPTAMGDASAREEIDLADDRRRDIHDMEKALENPNLFTIFGVANNSSPEVVRKAFYELSRKFHPDRYFQKNLGSYRARVELLFRKLMQAHETLTDEKKRFAYLKRHPAFASPASSDSGSNIAGVAAAMAPAPPRAKTAEDDAREAERRSRFAKHPYFAKGARMTELVTRAKERMSKGDYGHAFTDLHMAHQMDMKNEEVNKLLTEVRAKNDLARAAVEEKRGFELLEQGNEAQALAAFKSAVNIDAKSPKAAFMTAKLMWEKSGDPKEAQPYAQKAVDADPKNPEAHVMLARLMDSAGMKAMAKKHFEEALKLDPNNAEAKKHVKGRWPF